MAIQSLGTLIWISIRPMLRLILCGLTGYIITKCDRLPPIAARGAGQIMLNIALPSLFFSKIVPTFNPQNISALGPLVLVCVLYQIIGLLTALVVSILFWVPYRFRWGIIVAGVWGNYGDVPTAIIMSVTAVAPFKSDDQDRAVAYIAAFLLVFMITLFPMGGHYLIARDFYGPDEDDCERRLSFKERSKKIGAYFPRPFRSQEVPQAIQCEEKGDSQSDFRPFQSGSDMDHNNSRDLRKISLDKSPVNTNVTPPTPSGEEEAFHSRGASTVVDNGPNNSQNALFHSKVTRAWRKSICIFQAIVTVPTTIIISAFVISVIPRLKGLFVMLPTSPKAPDGEPPLAFVLDTATFLGGASVPLGLIGLGSALARIHVPRSEWKRLPLGSIFSLAVGRMILQPILGVLIVQGLTKAGVISKDDKVLQFVSIFFSCVPTATTQIFLTQAYSTPGAIEHLPAFLVPQYILMFISCTILTAYTLHLLFG